MGKATERRPDGSRTDARGRRGPGRPRGATGPKTRQEILEPATALFSRYGEAGVGMREVAAAAGVNVATVHHHFGSKAELYEAVFAAMYALESAVVGAAAERVRERIAADPDALLQGLHEVLDAYLDFLDEHPEVTFLWLRRWLEPQAHPRFDEEYAMPLYRLVEDLLLTAERTSRIDEPSPHTAVRSIVWAVHGHVTAARAGSSRAAAAERREFREFAHRLVDGLWGPAP